MKSPIVLLESLFQDIKRLSPDLSVRSLDRDLITIKNRFKHEGIGFLSVSLPKFCDAFDLSLAKGRWTHYTSFSMYKSLPKFLQGLTSLVFDINTGLLRDDCSIEAIVSIRQICRLFKKLVLSSNRAILLEKEAVLSFFDTDDTLLNQDFCPSKVDLINKVTRFILRNINFDDIKNRNGPGAVAENLSMNQKWSHNFNEIMSDKDNGFWDFDYDMFINDHEIKPFLGCSSISAKLVVVPKTAVAVRTITIEPGINQFRQQGVNTHLRNAIDRCQILSKSLTLTDQTRNQKLALEGSLSGLWTTVDLSSASDLLSVKLVKLVFRNSPQLVERLIGSRTSSVTYNGIERNIEKYAGMGNATTFPVQSIVFTILSICALLELDGIKNPSIVDVKARAAKVCVFGDDIIVPTNSYHTLREWISSFGLRVNEAKTFSEGNFRESCGTDAFSGVDVTPVYVRINPLDLKKKDSDLMSVISTANQLWLKGYYEMSNTIKSIVEGFLRKKLPMVSPNSGLLGWHSRCGASDAHCWDKNLHTLLTKSLSIRSIKRIDKLDDMPALFKFFHTSLIERGADHLERSPIRYKVRIVPSKVPTHVG